jgi:branched-chain amino acid transport system permease protein
MFYLTQISSYFFYLLSLVGIWSILALGLQISVGGGGIINLAYIAFAALAAYLYAILTVIFNFPIWLSLILALLFPLIFSFLLSLATTRLKGDYLVAISLWFLFVVHTLLLSWQNLTRGALGIPGIPRLGIFSQHEWFAFLTIFFVLFAFTTAKYLFTSPLGRLMGAVRDDELGAAALGKNTLMVKHLIYLFSAFYAALGGILLAMFLRFIDPSSFYIDQLVLLLSIVIVGGLASLSGTFFATLLLVLLPEILRFFIVDPDFVGAFRQFLYALLLLIIILYWPKGFFGKIILD